MKKKSLKLNFNKETIAKLQMDNVKGGEKVSFDTNCGLCYPYTGDWCEPTQAKDCQSKDCQTVDCSYDNPNNNCDALGDQTVFC